eukprot:m.10179 g.10179  ORF g.10179 m.10179 type:complete len:52 (+) comp3625_c0_seq2:398-553(+)
MSLFFIFTMGVLFSVNKSAGGFHPIQKKKKRNEERVGAILLTVCGLAREAI